MQPKAGELGITDKQVGQAADNKQMGYSEDGEKRMWPVP